jgi:exportin-5
LYRYNRATIRSEKKAANRVKEMLVAAAGGGDALRAFAEARAGATSTGAIQVPNITAARHQGAAAAAAAAGAWTEEDVNASGLNPLTANVRQYQ